MARLFCTVYLSIPMSDYPHIAAQVAMVVAIGLLTGLEREHERKEGDPLFAGIRTFPLIALVGYVAGLLGKAGFGAVLAVALGGVFLLVSVEYVLKALGEHRGATTEFVAVLTFLSGALVALDYMIPAATIAVVATLALMLKQPLHLLAQKIQAEEIYAILKFTIITVIVLPLLPNRDVGPMQLLNPRFVWWMVVFVSAISMVGYVLMRFLSAQKGISLTGLFGGLASSTAATVDLAGESRASDDSLASCFALGIVVACSVMYFRVFFEAYVVDPGLGRTLILPVAIPTVVGLGTAALLWFRDSGKATSQARVENPMEIGKALKFGFFFAVILVVSKLAFRYFGTAGIYLASVAAGLSQVDATTVTAARLAQEKTLAYSTANGAILLASASNTLVKGILAIAMGRPSLRRVVGWALAAMLASNLAVFVWVVWR